ncbi:hypothetical protein NL676_026433 [Syzygium grande]|nr:hypothetical protein NL676_026433 [Syzygium grande]
MTNQEVTAAQEAVLKSEELTSSGTCKPRIITAGFYQFQRDSMDEASNLNGEVLKESASPSPSTKDSDMISLNKV